MRRLQDENNLNSTPLKRLDAHFLRTFFILGTVFILCCFHGQNPFPLLPSLCTAILVALSLCTLEVTFASKKLYLYTIGIKRPGHIEGKVHTGYIGYSPAIYFKYYFIDSQKQKITASFKLPTKFKAAAFNLRDGESINILVDENERRHTSYIADEEPLYNLRNDYAFKKKSTLP